MTKKDYLIKLMELLSPEVLPIAPNILALLQSNAMSDELIDTFYTMFHEYALTIKNEEGKEKIKKSMNFLDKLKSLEGDEQIKNQKDINELESMLQNM